MVGIPLERLKKSPIERLVLGDGVGEEEWFEFIEFESIYQLFI